MPAHSKFLVHWTGSSGEDDIERQPAKNRPELYLKRLIDYYKNGLFARRTVEEVVRGMNIKHIVRLCFTEVRLSQAQTHADRYGKLGIGFKRDFIVEKGGRPVIYVPYHAKEGSRLLEDSIGNAYERSKDDPETQKSAKWIMAHVKRMGNDRIPDKYYEEMEWRIVYDESPGNQHFTKCKTDQEGEHRLKFLRADVQLIVFPDEDTRRMALENDDMQPYFDEHMPVLATLNDCGHF